MPTVFSHAVYEKEYFRHAPMKRNTGRKTVRNRVPLAKLVQRIQNEESTVVPSDDEATSSTKNEDKRGSSIAEQGDRCTVLSLDTVSVGNGKDSKDGKDILYVHWPNSLRHRLSTFETFGKSTIIMLRSAC